VPAVPPAQDPLRVNPKRRCLLDRRPASGRPEHNLDALRESSLRRTLSIYSLENRALTSKEFESRSMPSHGPDADPLDRLAQSLWVQLF
jgi:hypothetical protein